ncbi:MAG: hypothetical protein GC184_03345 [Rhizobiales bacterium]|nr:hypothetical protein [Hyphomicrobiales bacterium]
MTSTGLLRAAIFASVMSLLPVAAMADVGDGLIGNTVILAGPDGNVTRIYYQDDKTLVIRANDGTLAMGQWRVKDKSICTRMGEGAPENCTPEIDVPPTAGSSGVIPGENNSEIKWSVIAGKGF